MSEIRTLIDSLRDAAEDHDWYDVGVLLGHVADRIERLEGDGAAPATGADTPGVSPPRQRPLADVGVRLAAAESEVLDMLGQVAAARGEAREWGAACEKSRAEAERLRAELWDVLAENDRLRVANDRLHHDRREIARVLGEALGYPVAGDGTICTGEHSALSLVTEAAGKLGVLTAEAEKLRADNAALAAEWLWQPEMTPEMVALRDRAIEEYRGKAGTSEARSIHLTPTEAAEIRIEVARLREQNEGLLSVIRTMSRDR